MDVKTINGKYNWTNQRTRPWHINARLDRLLVQCSFLIHGLDSRPLNFSMDISDHKPINMELKEIPNLGPNPFFFSPLWIQHMDLWIVSLLFGVPWSRVLLSLFKKKK